MNEWDKLRSQAQLYKSLYPEGTRVVLNHMDDPWAPVPAGTRGTVVAVDDIGQLHMKWDNGRTLALVPGEDVFRKLNSQERLEEQRSFVDKLADASRRSSTLKDERGQRETERNDMSK